MSMKRVLTAFVLLAGASLGPSGCGSAPPPCVCPCAEGVGAGAAPEAEAPADDAWAGGEDTSGVQRFAVPVTAEQPSQGPADALVTMVVFSDFQCPFCARLNPTIEQLMRAYPTQLRVVWRNLPLAFHPNAMPAAEAAMEAFAQGGDRAFWQMRPALRAPARPHARDPGPPGRPVGPRHAALPGRHGQPRAPGRHRGGHGAGGADRGPGHAQLVLERRAGHRRTAL
ncbi:MAG: thioredoxin domain-containing protein [Sandaracinaceae bacterium]|nr:thioredoxin domain-containing protein [Sandaracinaceae bacterium]